MNSYGVSERDRKMQIYIYSEKDTLLHRIHPVVKIVLLLIYFQMAMTFQHPLYLLILSLVLILLATIGAALRAIWKFRYILAALFTLSFVLWTIFYRAEASSIANGMVNFNREGVLFGAGMGLRLSSMLIAGIIFLTTTKVEALAHGLNMMGIPYRASFTLTLAFRLVPLFIESALTIIEAQKSRGLALEGVNIARKVRGYIPLIIPVFASSLRAADNLALALEARAFGYDEKRTSFIEYRFSIRDIVALCLFLITDAVIIFLRIKGYGVI